MSEPLPAEFRLTVACCVWPPSTMQQEHIQKCLHDGIDWQRFLRVIQRHRVTGLVYANLKTCSCPVPVQTMQVLGASARKQVIEGLVRSAEACRIVGRLESSGIPVAVLKGPPLAMLAYGDIGLRHSKDNDLLVEPERVIDAARQIEAAGYVRVKPHPAWTPDDIDAWRDVSKNFEYVLPASGAQLELHWRLTDNPYLTLEQLRRDTLQRVALTPQAALPTLAADDLLLYLCVHGAGHTWFRLKWLADVAALLRQGGPETFARLRQQAQESGLKRPVDLALELCRILFDTPLPNDLTCDLSTRLLVRCCLDALTAGDGATEPDHRPFGTTRLALSSYLLTDDRRYRARQLKIDLTAGADAPSSLPIWLQIVPRAAAWGWRRARRAGRSKAA